MCPKAPQLRSQAWLAAAQILTQPRVCQGLAQPVTPRGHGGSWASAPHLMVGCGGRRGEEGAGGAPLQLGGRAARQRPGGGPSWAPIPLPSPPPPLALLRGDWGRGIVKAAPVTPQRTARPEQVPACWCGTLSWDGSCQLRRPLSCVPTEETLPAGPSPSGSRTAGAARPADPGAPPRPRAGRLTPFSGPHTLGDTESCGERPGTGLHLRKLGESQARVGKFLRLLCVRSQASSSQESTSGPGGQAGTQDTVAWDSPTQDNATCSFCPNAPEGPWPTPFTAEGARPVRTQGPTLPVVAGDAPAWH